MQPRHRYMAYAAAALAATLFVTFDEEPDQAVPGQPRVTARQPVIDLPELTASPARVSASVKRDVFKVVEPEPVAPAPVVAAAPEPPPPLSPPPPDRLAGLTVIGVVARGERQAILIETGEEVITVETGQQFGKDEALVIDGIENNRVLVTDKLANVTKTFLLSED